MQGKTVSETQLTMSQQMTPQDTNPAGNVHGGVIMKLIDTAGGLVAIRHTRSNTVTASIDRLDFHHPVYVGDLVSFKASLNLVGTTSMEVGVRVEAENAFTGDIRHTASAYLTYVSLDPDGKPQPVPPLILETEEDKRRNSQAQERKQARKIEKSNHK